MNFRIVLASLAATAAAVPVASANAADQGVIAYVRDSAVHVVRPDGTGPRAVTSPGGYASVAWAPDGTLWAGRNRELVHLDQRGGVLGTLAAPDLPFVEDVPVDLAVSADGSKLALTEIGMSCDSGCSRPKASAVVELRTGAVIAGPWHGAENLTWSGASTLFGVGGAAMDFAKFGLDGSASTVFNSPHADTNDVVLAPDGHTVAWVGYLGGSFAVISGTLSGSATGTGTVRSVCAYAPLLDAYRADPVFSPDSSELAYASPTGIQIATRPAPATEAECASVAEHTIPAPGASSMSWGAVAYETGASTAPPASAGAGANAGGADGQAHPGVAAPVRPAATGASTSSVDAPAAHRPGSTARPTLIVRRASRSAGFTLRIEGTQAGKATLTVRLGKKTVVRTKTTLSTQGSTVRVRLDAAARRALRRGGDVSLRVAVAGRDTLTTRVKL